MVVMKSNAVPKDAVVMSEEEAVIYAWDIVNNWEVTETWALRYGAAILGSVNAFSGFIINSHFRNKLKLGSFGYLSSVIPITAMPCVLTALFHRHFVSTQLLLMKADACPICLEIRSAAIQGSLGVTYPLSLAPISALMLANRYSTCRVPSMGEPKKLFEFVKKVTKPLSTTLVFLSIFQFVASSAITYFEMRNNFTMRRRIVEIENKITKSDKYLQN